MSTGEPRIAPGRYQHFKGAMYMVHGVLRNATNNAGYRPMVYYEAIDKDSLAPFNDGYDNTATHGFYVREISEFLEEVDWPDGTRGPRWRVINTF